MPIGSCNTRPYAPAYVGCCCPSSPPELPVAAYSSLNLLRVRSATSSPSSRILCATPSPSRRPLQFSSITSSAYYLVGTNLVGLSSTRTALAGLLIYSHQAALTRS